jgi:hypothetical protein
MIEVAEAISSFSQVSPADQLITLTISQLQTLIEEAVAPLEARIDALEAHVANQNGHISALESRQDDAEAWQDQHSLENALAYQRIKTLETHSTGTSDEQTARISKYLQGKPGNQASFAELRGYLNLSPGRFSQLVKSLDPQTFRTRRSSTNYKSKVLTLIKLK